MVCEECRHHSADYFQGNNQMSCTLLSKTDAEICRARRLKRAVGHKEVESVVCDETHTSFSGLLCSGSWLMCERAKKLAAGLPFSILIGTQTVVSLRRIRFLASMVNSRNIRSFFSFRILRLDRFCLRRENTQALHLDAECDFNHTEL